MKYFLIVLVSFSLMACSTFRSTSDYDVKTDFSNLKTYAWQTQNKETKYPGNDLVDKRVIQAVDHQLTKKGIDIATEESADILVRFFTRTEQKIDDDGFRTSIGFGSFGSSGWGSSVSVHSPVETKDVGILVVDMVQRETNKLIWRGTVEDVFREHGTPEERAYRIRKAVDHMLKEFPPKPVSATVD